jgi:hypothetical protein
MDIPSGFIKRCGPREMSELAMEVSSLENNLQIGDCASHV